MNNAVFSKTMENVRNYVNVQYVMRWDGRYDVDAMIVKPNFHRNVFSRNLIAIKMQKLEMKFDKPIYQISWVCVSSDISKCLYEFHHEYMLPLFHEKLCIPTRIVLFITSSETMFTLLWNAISIDSIRAIDSAYDSASANIRCTKKFWAFFVKFNLYTYVIVRKWLAA